MMIYLLICLTYAMSLLEITHPPFADGVGINPQQSAGTISRYEAYIFVSVLCSFPVFLICKIFCWLHKVHQCDIRNTTFFSVGEVELLDKFSCLCYRRLIELCEVTDFFVNIMNHFVCSGTKTCYQNLNKVVSLRVKGVDDQHRD